jgi:hypothetical protein
MFRRFAPPRTGRSEAAEHPAPSKLSGIDPV